MKTKYYILCSLLAFALVGCQNEETVALEEENICITGLDVQVNKAPQAADANGYEGLVKTTWAGGDELELTIGDFTGKARYYYLDENNKGWELLNADDTPVIGGILFTKYQMNEGIDVRAHYAKSGVADAFNDVLLAEKTDFTTTGRVDFSPRNDNPAAYTLAIRLVHTKSLISVALTNSLADETVTSVALVQRDSEGASQAALTMKAITSAGTYDVFADQPYVEKFVVTLQASDNTTRTIEAVPDYGTDTKGFAIEPNNRYEFNITLTDVMPAPAKKQALHGSQANVKCFTLKGAKPVICYALVGAELVGTL